MYLRVLQPALVVLDVLEPVVHNVRLVVYLVLEHAQRHVVPTAEKHVQLDVEVDVPQDVKELVLDALHVEVALDVLDVDRTVIVRARDVQEVVSQPVLDVLDVEVALVSVKK